MKPVLSICIPSRNRQLYFQQTIEALRQSLRTDIELVLADNSDDPSIMNDFMAERLADPRIVYLPSMGETLSMIDNWERTAAAATGDFMIFIGDDDYVDPEVVEWMNNILAIDPGVEAFGWRLVGYTWPYPGRPKLTSPVPFDASVVRVQQSDLFRRMFTWHDCAHVPTSGYSVYHSAISRRLMNSIKDSYGGRYFEHPVVDYDSAFKVICHGTNFVATNRPFGVMGSCPLSNSFGVGKLNTWRERIDLFISEVGHNYDEDIKFREFPFTSALGTTATVAVAQTWFKDKYGLKIENWGANFAKACAKDCENYADEADFNAAAEAYRMAFSLWEDGKYLRNFTPLYKGGLGKGKTVSSGFTADSIYIDQDVGVSTPAEMFALVRGLVWPVDQLDLSAIRHGMPKRQNDDMLERLLA